MTTLELEMVYRLTAIRGPLADTDGSPHGRREHWEMTEGYLCGRRINAKLAMPGGDWMRTADDGYARPDVRVQFTTHDGATVLLHYDGLVEQNETFTTAARDDRATCFDDHYMRMAMRFDTGAARYRWLNQHLFVARGRLLGTHAIEYEVFLVT